MNIGWQEVGLFLLSLLSATFGWLLRQLWDAVSKLKQDITDLERDMRQNFARRDDVRDMFDQIMQGISRLHEEIARKADK